MFHKINMLQRIRKINTLPLFSTLMQIIRPNFVYILFAAKYKWQAKWKTRLMTCAISLTHKLKETSTTSKIVLQIKVEAAIKQSFELIERMQNTTRLKFITLHTVSRNSFEKLVFYLKAKQLTPQF